MNREFQISSSALIPTLNRGKARRKSFPASSMLFVVFGIQFGMLLFQCQNGSCQTCALTSNVNHLCLNAVSTYQTSSFFLFPNTTKPQIVNTSAHQLEFSKILPLSCRQIFTAFMCAWNYPPCFFIPFPENVPWPSVVGLPRYPCRSLCLEFLEKCASDILMYSPQYPLPNCSSIDSSTNLPIFPQHSIQFTVNRQNITSLCFNYSGTLPQAPAPLLCPPPLVFAEDQDPQCVIRCPIPIIPNWVNVTRRSLMLSLGCIGEVFIILVIISYSSRPRNREYPGPLVLLMAIATFFFLLSNIIGAGSYSNSVCLNSAEERGEDDAFCLVIGIMYVFSSLMAACFWCFLSLHLALTLYFGLNDKRVMLFKWHLYLTSFIIPLVSVIGALSLGELNGSGGILLGCFIGTFNSNVDIFFFFIPLIILMAVGVICICFTLCQFFLIRIQMTSARTQSRSRDIKDLKLILFLLLYILVIGIPIALRFKIRVGFGQIEAGLSYWLQCSIENLVTETANGQVNNPTQNELCQVMNNHFPQRPPAPEFSL